ncbi:MAG: calcium/sodium antiporter [Lachnospiraceae bacterium]|nr:calcium/sodium antiporter [Lachnospiraceae bacterium]
MTILTWILLIIGFVLLIKGADFFVDGASAVAKKLHVPQLVIGMTIVAMGTSLPETAVSITASLAGANQMAVSNVVGSNIFNLLVVAGCAALICPMAVGEQTLKKDLPLSVFCALFLAVAGGVSYFVTGEMVLGRICGVLLLAIFVWFLLDMIKVAKKNKVEDEEDNTKEMSVIKMILLILVGGTFITIGGDLVVDESKIIASAFGMSDTLIGLTIVALGTSLPELVTGIVAAKKGAVDLALGNVVGSNIFNILMVLGLAAVVSPMSITVENIIDIGLLVVFSLIVWFMSKTKKTLVKSEGLIMVLIYFAYLAYIIARNYVL